MEDTAADNESDSRDSYIKPLDSVDLNLYYKDNNTMIMEVPQVLRKTEEPKFVMTSANARHNGPSDKLLFLIQKLYLTKNSKLLIGENSDLKCVPKLKTLTPPQNRRISFEHQQNRAHLFPNLCVTGVQNVDFVRRESFKQPIQNYGFGNPVSNFSHHSNEGFFNAPQPQHLNENGIGKRENYEPAVKTALFPTPPIMLNHFSNDGIMVNRQNIFNDPQYLNGIGGGEREKYDVPANSIQLSNEQPALFNRQHSRRFFRTRRPQGLRSRPSMRGFRSRTPGFKHKRNHFQQQRSMKPNYRNF